MRTSLERPASAHLDTHSALPGLRGSRGSRTSQKPGPVWNITKLSPDDSNQPTLRRMTTAFQETESSVRLTSRSRTSEDSSTLCESASMEHSEPLLRDGAEDQETGPRPFTWSKMPFWRSRNRRKRGMSGRAIEADILGRRKRSRRCLTLGIGFLAVLYVFDTLNYVRVIADLHKVVSSNCLACSDTSLCWLYRTAYMTLLGLGASQATLGPVFRIGQQTSQEIFSPYLATLTMIIGERCRCTLRLKLDALV